MVADKNRKYNWAPRLSHRASLYARLKQYDKALADYTAVVQFPNVSPDAFVFRGRFLASRGQWQQAADDYRSAWQMMPLGADWWGEAGSGQRAILNLMVDDMDGYREATVEVLTRTEGKLNGNPCLWLVRTYVAAPGMITNENRDRLLKAVYYVPEDWKPRLTAALHYRTGEFQQAADLFDQNPKGPAWPAFQFLAAMAHHKLGNHVQAKKLFDEANDWVRQQEGQEKGPAVPTGQCGTTGPLTRASGPKPKR